MKETKLTHFDPYPIVEVLDQCRSAQSLDELNPVVDQLVNSIESLEIVTLLACFVDGQAEVILGDMSPDTGVPHYLGATDRRPCGITDPRSAAHAAHPCIPDDTAIIRVDGTFCSACQKGVGRADSTCMAAKLNTRIPPMGGLMAVQMILPYLHDALIRTVELCCGAVRKCSLTKRELEVWYWICEGKTNWEIATILGLAERTVKFHIRNLFDKLGVTHRSQTAAKDCAYVRNNTNNTPL